MKATYIKLPEDLKKFLEAEAKKNNRKLTQEITHRLEQSKCPGVNFADHYVRFNRVQKKVEK